MQEHTTGPWKAHHKTDAHCNNRFMITGISRHEGRIAHVADDVVEHNVALITASPDLLDALYSALPIIEDCKSDPCYKAGYVSEVEKKIASAIAKATGSAQ